jgi:GDPmannose 4,6-dehydratase
MFVACGILFNHEGEFRGNEFVTRKITSNIAKLKYGLISNFSLGSLEPKRDWGYAGDFAYAMWLMLQHPTPDTFVISTGETHSIREFVEESLRAADLDTDIERFVTFDKKMVRPSEVDLLVGDSSKANSQLNWKPKVGFQELVKIMVENDMRILESQLSKKSF